MNPERLEEILTEIARQIRLRDLGGILAISPANIFSLNLSSRV